MSCDIFGPNGHLIYLYQPNGVLKHVSRLDSSSRCIAQYPCFASCFVKCLAPASLWEIPSRVGVLWCVLLMHLFSGFGFKHIRNAPFSSCYMQLHSPSLLVHLPSLSHLCLPFFQVLSLILLLCEQCIFLEVG